MAMNDYNKSEFKFSETFNNSDGKTSGSGFVGVILGLLTGVGFIIGIFAWFLELPNVIDYFEKVLQLGFLSASLMGVRKLSGAFGNNKNSEKL